MACGSPTDESGAAPGATNTNSGTAAGTVGGSVGMTATSGVPGTTGTSMVPSTAVTGSTTSNTIGSGGMSSSTVGTTGTPTSTGTTGFSELPTSSSSGGAGGASGTTTAAGENTTSTNTTGGDDNCSGGDQVDFALTGWATEAGGTTGGKGGTTITVATGVELAQALKDKQDSSTPLTILVNGTISIANSGDVTKFDVKDLSDVSIIGTGDGAEFDGIGIKIFKASNVILRNLKIHNVVIGDKDAISIEGPADHIWIDHCELYAEYQNVDKDYYDGLLDAKAEAEYITYSWNYLHDSWKTSLVGSSESDTFDRKLSMHHNYYKNCNSRLPLFRGGNGHVFNNLYEDVHSTAVNSRLGACLKVENNVFDNVRNPWISAYSDELGGAELVCNALTGGSSFDVSGSDEHEPPSCVANVPYEYQHTLNHVDQLADIVRNHAGVGKLSDPTDF